MASPAPEPGVESEHPAGSRAWLGSRLPGPAPMVSLHWRTALLIASAFVTLALVSGTMLFPAPYVVLYPGPTINTLGKDGGHDLITVSGHPTYPAKGRLDLTTVTVRGGPGTRLSVYDVLSGWLRRDRLVMPVDVLYPPGQTVESERQENQEEMVSSQESATAAALRELGIHVPTTITVKSVDAGRPPSPLRAGDVIVAVAGHRIVDLDALASLLAGVEAGTPVRVTVRRSGSETTLTVPTRSHEGRRTVLGIRVDLSIDPPFDVRIRIDNIGGPSAGMMFALGVVDLLSPGDLTGGQHIAGTGTIAETGQVGAIGGIQQKLVGARRAGARWFLAPADNCGDVAGHVPDGLRVIPVHDLHEARAVVDRIAGGHVDGFASCPAVAGGSAGSPHP